MYWACAYSVSVSVCVFLAFFLDKLKTYSYSVLNMGSKLEHKALSFKRFRQALTRLESAWMDCLGFESDYEKCLKCRNAVEDIFGREIDKAYEIGEQEQ